MSATNTLRVIPCHKCYGILRNSLNLNFDKLKGGCMVIERGIGKGCRHVYFCALVMQSIDWYFSIWMVSWGHSGLTGHHPLKLKKVTQTPQRK